MKKLVAVAVLAAGLAVGSAPASAISPLGLAFKMAMIEEGLPPGPAKKVAKEFCRAADRSSVTTALGITVVAAKQTGVSVHDAGFIVGAGTPAFCPWHSTALRRLVESA
jgi:hypothetical protein